MSEQPKEAAGGSWFGGWGKAEDLAKMKEQLQVLEEEIARKAAENATLHSEVHATKQEQRQVIELLEKKARHVKQELESEKDYAKKKEREFLMQKEEMENANKNLNATISHLTSSVKEIHAQLANKEKEFASAKVQFSRDSENYIDTIKRHIPVFDDTKMMMYNELNLPSYDKESLAKLRSVTEQTVQGFSEFVVSLYEEGNSLRERLVWLDKAKDLSSASLQLHKKIDAYLGEYKQQLDPIRNGIEAIFSNSPDSDISSLKKDLVNSCNNFLQWHDQLSSALQSALKEESRQRDCVKSMQHLNESIHNAYDSFSLALEKALAAGAILIEEDASTQSHLFALKHAQESFSALVTARKALAELLIQKLTRENEDAYIIPQLHKVNERYTLGLKSATSLLEKVVEGGLEYIKLLTRPAPLPVKGVQFEQYEPVHKNTFQARAQKWSGVVNDLLQDPNMVHVPYHDQLLHIEEIRELKEKTAEIFKKLELVNETVKTLQGEKEKLFGELSKSKDSYASKQNQLNSVLAELASTRLDLQKLRAGQPVEVREEIRETPVKEESKEEKKSEEEELPPGLKKKQAAQAPEGKKWNLMVLNENGQQSDKLELSPEDKEREKQLKQYYQDHTNQLTALLKSADARAIETFARQEELERKIQAIKNEREEVIKKLEAAKNATGTVVEELETTKKNYEQQLSVLTEHVVQMTQKLSQTQDELESVKAFKVRCGKCQTWNTIEWLMANGKNGRYCSRGAHPSSLNYA
eukprot:TRINITY_DN5002_c0_g1_i1.p1 TRINITY_DN5002_c0_g1~~TRINITY_DN5002_c0_g1_i1.p1  ORF type:complete len:844 (-),score=242.92 TRINITY_DN5002_c0_g1_i1:70-2334(-)